MLLYIPSPLPLSYTHRTAQFSSLSLTPLFKATQISKPQISISPLPLPILRPDLRRISQV